MKVKTSELTGTALDWAVAKCEELEVYFEDGLVCLVGQPFDTYWRYWNPSADWAQGGPIIEREKIRLDCAWNPGLWSGACKIDGVTAWTKGDTPLIAAMRCFVSSRLGNEVEIPDELKGESKCN